jgi:hypothetical protein
MHAGSVVQPGSPEARILRLSDERAAAARAVVVRDLRVLPGTVLWRPDPPEPDDKYGSLPLKFPRRLRYGVVLTPGRLLLACGSVGGTAYHGTQGVTLLLVEPRTYPDHADPFAPAYQFHPRADEAWACAWWAHGQDPAPLGERSGRDESPTDAEFAAAFQSARELQSRRHADEAAVTARAAAALGQGDVVRAAVAAGGVT